MVQERDQLAVRRIDGTRVIVEHYGAGGSAEDGVAQYDFPSGNRGRRKGSGWEDSDFNITG
jgi:hypothetical protein